MKIVSSVMFILGLLLITAPVRSQSDRRSEAEYNAALTKALAAALSRDRRVLTQETFYAGPNVTGTRKIVSEFAGPDAGKIEVIEEFGGKKSKFDSVRIGERFFCREGDRSWKKANKECAKGGRMMVIPDGDYEYSVEADSNNSGRKIYTRRAKFEDSGNPERAAVRMRFIEITFATDETGAITQYTETRRGGLEPNSWSSTQVTRYDYQPADLKIIDPINGN